MFLLAVLVATTGIALDQPPPPAASRPAPPATSGRRWSRPSTASGDWLSQWRDWARKETDRRAQSSSATPDPTASMAPACPPRPGGRCDPASSPTSTPSAGPSSSSSPSSPSGWPRSSFATSYGALYAYARDTGLYSDRLTRLWPLLLDGAFIVAQLAAILAGILRGSRGWPILTMLLTGALTVWFNLQHAGADPGRRLAAALPPVLMMLAFEIDVQIVRWVMTALGKPLGPIAPPPPDGMLPGAVWRSDGLGWNVPPHGLPGGWPPGAYGQVPAGHHLPENRQNGQTGLPAGNGADPAGMTKRQRIEEYLDWLGPERAPEPDRARADRRPGQPGPGGHRALRQADPRPATAPTPAPAAGERRPASRADDRSRTRARGRPGAACARCPSPTGSHRTTWRPRRPCSGRSWPPGGCWPRSPPCSRRPTSTGPPIGPSGGPCCAWPTAASPPTR